jgi:ferredoxin--NADP+ reductase
MLALSPEELAPTDTTDVAIEAINDSPLREIVLLARRGPAQAAFTTPELKEMGELADTDVIVDPADLEGATGTDTNSKRNLEVLREYAARTPSGRRRAVVFRFCVSPVEIRGEGRVEEVEVVHNELVADGSGGVRAVPTGRHETIPCGLVFRSVGYRGVALPGVPFDEELGVIPNDCGRVEAGLYCAGWIKRGPTGVIGTNKKDATETVELLLEDARSGLLHRDSDERLESLLAERGVEMVAYGGWKAIDLEERTRGEPHGRPRIKLCTWDELLATAKTVAAHR